MYKTAKKFDATWNKKSEQQVKKIQKQWAKQGKTMPSAIKNKIRYGYTTTLWTKFAKDSGYNYVEIKPKNRGF